MSERNIFLSAVGVTPQVLTEGLYALWMEKKAPVHSIEVITTPKGKSILEENDFFHKTKNPIRQMFEEYKIAKRGFPYPQWSLKSIHVPSGTKKADLDDTHENRLMEGEITRCLRTYTSNPETKLWVSLAGGRKTMSAYLILAMTVQARSQDTLWHVLFNGPGGNAPRGWWYPKAGSSAEKKWVNLFEVPFPRLRQMIQKHVPDGLYKSLTEAFTGFNREMTAPELEIHKCQDGIEIMISGRSLKAEPKQKVWLALLANRKTNRRFCPPKARNCVECKTAPCAVRVQTGAQKAGFNFDSEDLRFLSELLGRETGSMDSEVSSWAPVASRLGKAIQEQFPEYFEFLDSIGGKGLGAKARRHVLSLERGRITVKL